MSVRLLCVFSAHARVHDEHSRPATQRGDTPARNLIDRSRAVIMDALTLTPSGGAAGGASTPEEKPHTCTTSPSSHADGWVAEKRRCTGLTSAQLGALQAVKRAGSTSGAAVLVLNPLGARSGEIVHVSEAWQAICGISEPLALRKDLGWLLESAETDGDTGGVLSSVLSSVLSHISGRRACKALALHAREGRPPFWSTLALSPLVRRGELLLYVCALKDCSSSVTAKLKRPPTARCRSTPCQQLPKHFAPESATLFAKPAVLELDLAFLRSHPTAAGMHQLLAPPPTERACMLVRRLGWYQLKMEPEVLVERLVGALEQLNASYELVESSTPLADYFAVRARFDGDAVVSSSTGTESRDHEGAAAMASESAISDLVDELELLRGEDEVIANFVVTDEVRDRSHRAGAACMSHGPAQSPACPALTLPTFRCCDRQCVEGTYRLTCTRLSGRTILFHRIYRQLHRTLLFTDDEFSARTPPQSATSTADWRMGFAAVRPMPRCSAPIRGDMQRSRRRPVPL